MTDIARLRFQSVTRPKEKGRLVLSDDGTLRIEPSEAFRDEMSRLESVALRRATLFGTGGGLLLMGLGALALALGWYVGRVFGKLGVTLTAPRPVRDVKIERNAAGGVRLTLHGVENRLQVVQMAWNGDEVLPADADKFMQIYEEMRGEK